MPPRVPQSPMEVTEVPLRPIPKLGGLWAAQVEAAGQLGGMEGTGCMVGVE